ncbi:MAG: cyclase family protein [Chloroflexota bacterium]
MKIFDISLTITPALATWPGDPKVVLERVNKMEDGANANVSRLDMGVHTGTHVDAPFHFIPVGETVESMRLDVLIGIAWVVHIPDEVRVITRETLEKARLPEEPVRVLFRTRNSQLWQIEADTFHADFVGIDASGAQYLVEKGVQLVGVDYLSVAPYKLSRPTHQILLKAQVVVIEGLNLSAVEAGQYRLVCLPLKLGGSDGAPARAVLLQD